MSRLSQADLHLLFNKASKMFQLLCRSPAGKATAGWSRAGRHHVSLFCGLRMLVIKKM